MGQSVGLTIPVPDVAVCILSQDALDPPAVGEVFDHVRGTVLIPSKLTK